MTESPATSWPGFEQVGSYRIYPPSSPDAPWGISHDGLWLPVLCADRNACQAILDLDEHSDWWNVMAELEQLQKTGGRSGALTAADITRHIASRYAVHVNAPLHPGTVAALNERLAGEYPVRTVARDR